MVKIIIDSATDIDAKEAEERGLIMIPMEITIEDKQYFDGVDLSKREFFEKLIECSELPKTSQINEFRFDEEFKKVVDAGDEAVVILISSKLSGTYSGAKRAAKKYDGKIFVVDSLNACIGERVLVDYAERLVAEGKSASEIAKILDEKKSKIKLLALLGTLKYLKKGGRISPLVAFAGELMNVKPVVSVINGEVKLVGKALGSKKGNNLLMKLVSDCGGIDFDMPYALGYSGLDDTLLKKYIEDSKSLWEGKTTEPKSFMIGSTIGTHVGPGAIAVVFFAK